MMDFIFLPRLVFRARSGETDATANLSALAGRMVSCTRDDSASSERAPICHAAKVSNQGFDEAHAVAIVKPATTKIGGELCRIFKTSSGAMN